MDKLEFSNSPVTLDPIYSESQVNKKIQDIENNYKQKLASLQYDLDEMRKLYQESERKIVTQAKNFEPLRKRNYELKHMNLQLMKLYYNEATNKEIKDLED
jgi:hypothetical protein